MSDAHPAVGVASAFLDAVVWGRHSTIWELLSPTGRDRVLEAGGRSGLDSVMAERIRQGTSPRDEMDQFLSGLVRGLRVDLSAADLAQIEVAPDVTITGHDGVQVLLHAPAPFHQEPWCVGSIDLSSTEDSWRVDKVHPRRVVT